MNKAAPWNVRGVGLDTRDAAREAARRAGLSLGEWLDQVIAEEATALGVEAEDIDADDRLEAVTAKLSRMAGQGGAARKPGRDSATRPRIRPARPAAREAAQRSAYDTDEPGDARSYGYGDAGPVQARPAGPQGFDPETLLDAAIARMENRGKEAQRQTTAALENVSARLGEIETHITARRDDTTILPIKSALGRLEERLENLSRRPAPPRTDARVEASLRDLTERLDEVAEKIDRSATPKPNEQDAAHFLRLDNKLSSLITHLSESEARRASSAVTEERARKAEAEQRARTTEAEARARAAEAELRAKSAEAEQRVKAAEAEARALAARRPAQALRAIAQTPFADTVSDIGRRQRALDAPGTAPPVAQPDPAFGQRLELIASRIEKAADAASGAGRSNGEAFNSLHGEIARLAKRLDDMRSDARRTPEVHPDVVQLKRDISSMSQAVADLAPRGSVAALETAVRDLATRIEVSRQEGARENLLAPVEALVSDLQSTLKDFDPRATIYELEREIKLIGHKVETMTLTGFDPEAFRRIHSQSQEIRDLLTAAASRPLPVEKIEKQISALGARVEQLAQAHARAPQPDVTLAIGEIRTMFDRAMVERAAPNPHIAALEKRLETLAHKIDQAVARPVPQPPLPPSPAPVADTSGIERMMARFAERIESARQTNHDPKVFEALQRQIALISEKLDQSDAGLKTIGAIETSIADLFAGMEKNRAATLTAAENAARTAAAEAAEKAARASLREVMQNLPQPPRSLAETQAIQRDLVDIRAEQESTGKRAHAAMNAVHVTLEKVVDRLASLEIQRSDLRELATVDEARQAGAEAARATARDTVLEALQNLPAPVTDPYPAQALQRGIVELRAEHEAAGQRTHATMNAVHQTLEKVVDRLATLEDTRSHDALPTFEQARELAADAARLAAREALHEAIGRLPPPPDPLEAALIKSEVADLRVQHAEAGERTHSTLKAVHQTLEKVVERLTSLEDEKSLVGSEAAAFAFPSRDVQTLPADPAKRDEPPVFAPAPRRFDMVVDPETLKPQAKPRLPEAPAPAARPAPPVFAKNPVARPAMDSVQLADGPDMLLEPGSGFPPHRGAGPAMQTEARPRAPEESLSLHGVHHGVHAEAAAGSAAPASFIAAARRAAQAAAAEAEATADKRSPGKRGAAVPYAAAGAPATVVAAPGSGGVARLALAKTFVSARRKPILIGLTGLMVVLGAAMIVRSFLAGGAPVQKAELEAADLAPPPPVIAEPRRERPAAATPATPVAAATQAALAPVPVPADPLSISPQAKTPAALPGAVAAVSGDLASRNPGRARQQTATIAPAPDAAQPDGRAPGIPRGPARPIDIDQMPVGAIDGKSGGTIDPALAAVSARLRESAQAGNAAAQFEMGLRFAEGRTVGRDLKIAAIWLEKAAAQGLVPAQYRIGSLYEKGLGVARDIGLAKTWYGRAAEGGNMRAMHNLAVLTAEGAGGKPDYAAAAQWFKKAAEYGVRDSQYNLAILYARGLGIELSLAQAYTWFSLAANQGDEDAAKKRDEVAGKLDPKALAAAKAGVEGYKPTPSAAASNDVPAPTGGWDAAAPKAPASGKSADKV